MRQSLAELKALHREQAEKKQKKTTTYVDNEVYPFWKAEPGQEIEFRILADADETNKFIYQVEKLTHKIHINGRVQIIPCLTMYGDPCPNCERSQKWYREEGEDSPKGKYFWRKREIFVRGQIFRDPLPVDDKRASAVGLVKTFPLYDELETAIVGGLAGFADTDTPPWDLDNGVNFVIRKKMNGKWPDYSMSGFMRGASPIPAEMRANTKLIELATLLPKNPGLDHVIALLEAHDNGGDYNESAPAKTNVAPSNTATTTKETVPAKTEFQGDDKIPFEATTPVSEKAPVEPVKVVETKATPVVDNTGTADEEDIMAKIRNRKQNKG